MGVPYDFPLPSEQCLDEDQREEVRDWVLQLSMDQKVVQSLQDFELDFVRENLRLDDTKEYFRALQSEYMVPAGPVAPMILKTATQKCVVRIGRYCKLTRLQPVPSHLCV